MSWASTVAHDFFVFTGQKRKTENITEATQKRKTKNVTEATQKRKTKNETEATQKRKTKNETETTTTLYRLSEKQHAKTRTQEGELTKSDNRPPSISLCP